MASTKKAQLFDGSQLLTTTNGVAQRPNDAATDLIGFLKATNVNASTTLDVTIEHSPNKTDWFLLGTFAQLVNVDGQESINITANVHANVRAVAVLAGATQEADVLCELYYDDKKDD